jgi:hypothetical protein
VVPDLRHVVEQTLLGRIPCGGLDGLFHGELVQVRTLDGRVEVVDVRRVVLVVVKLQRALGDVRLERRVFVRQRG